MKRFGTQLKQLLAGMNKEERLTPSELIERVNAMRNGSTQLNDGVIEAALKTPRFLRKIIKAYRRSPSRQALGTHLRQPPRRDHHWGRPASLLRLRVPVSPVRGCGPDHD